MGHTNSTANLALPQFIGTDKPTWLGDINGAFAAIDAYAGTNDAAVSAAVADASSAVSQASSAVNTANTANTTAGNASTAANNAVGVANTANAIAGAVDAKVGLLADLNTTDRSSIVNAINEIEGEVNPGSVSVTADGIKTMSALLSDLYNLVDLTKITENSKLYTAGYIIPLINKGVSDLTYSYTKINNVTTTLTQTYLVSAASTVFDCYVDTTPSVNVVDQSTFVPGFGTEYKILY